MRLIDADAYIDYCTKEWIPLNVDAVNEQPTIEPDKEHTNKRTETHECDSDRAETHGDVISRQAAIERIRGYYVAVENENDDWFNDGLDTAVVELSNMPSAEPDATDINVGGLISRQAMAEEIKEVYEWHDTVTKERMLEHLKNLPSAEPEIIRCKDCKWWSKTPLTINRRCSIFNVDTSMTFFCKHGSRFNE